MKKMMVWVIAAVAVIISLIFLGTEVEDKEIAELYQLSLLLSGCFAAAVSIERHMHDPRLVLMTFFLGLIPCLFAWQTIVVYVIGTVVLSLLNRGEAWRQINSFCQE